ncbi:DNA-directed RNA polymerase subunit H [Candidatus Woesearchaeota archaeon]|nr:MAG: DNA-directed RNA polymerase subunit H [Candidatus Woesearchaeota archaeon]
MARKKASTDESFDVREHILVPRHEKLSKEEAAKVLEQYHTTIKEMPKILTSDPALRGLGVKPGDIIKITRKSYTAGSTVFYRGVVSE